MKYFVGIDHGGSKSEILIGDKNGKLIDKYTSSGYIEFAMELQEKYLKPENLDVQTYNSEFISKYAEQLAKYLESILTINNLELSDVYALFGSMAGIDGGDIQMNFETEFHKRISIKNVAICNDMYGAWRAGTNKRPSGVLAIGTGTNIMFFDENGGSTSLEKNIKHQAARELGWRAFWHTCFSAVNWLEPTILTEKICEFAETSTVEEALTKTNHGRDTTLLYQFFVPHVYEAAEKKDRVAVDFVNQVGLGFAECIRTGIKDFGWENREIPLVLNGGSFKGKGYVMEKVIKDSLADLPNLKLFQSEYEPVYGALILAYEKYNNGVIPQMTNEDISKLKLKRKL